MDPTATRRLDRIGVEVTQFGLGGGPLGLPMDRATDEDALGALDAAWDSGVRYFDTAPWYGRGMSEHRVGRFLRSKADEPYVISSKVGRVLSAPAGARRASGGVKGGPHDFDVRYDYTREGILRSHEDSLQRLGVTAIDLAVVHDLDLGYLSPQERMDAHVDQLLTSGWDALKDLQAQGVIKGIGFGINENGLMSRWLDLFDPDFFLVAGPYTLMEQSALHDELARCAERGVSLIIGVVLGSGLLATGPVAGARYWGGEATEEQLEKARGLEQVCKRHGTSLTAAALQFPLGHPAVAAIIPGAKNRSEVDTNLAAFRHRVPAELWDELKSEGLLDPSTPTPASPV